MSKLGNSTYGEHLQVDAAVPELLLAQTRHVGDQLVHRVRDGALHEEVQLRVRGVQRDRDRLVLGHALVHLVVVEQKLGESPRVEDLLQVADGEVRRHHHGPAQQPPLRVGQRGGHVGVGDQVDEGAVVESLLEVAAEEVRLAAGQEEVFTAVVFKIHHRHREILRLLADGDGVDEQDDAGEEEDEEEEEDVPLHRDPVLDEERCNVGGGGEHVLASYLWLSFW